MNGNTLNHTQELEALGRILDAQDGRNDGVAITTELWNGLETGLRAWFFDLVFPGYDDIPLSENEQFTVEFLARNEISFFQAVETAIACKGRGYSKVDLGWLVDWLARLMMGAHAASRVIPVRGPLYASVSLSDRFDAFSKVLASVLPQKPGSVIWISRHVPLLTLSCHAVAASAFQDARRLEEVNKLYASTIRIMDESSSSW